MPAFTTATNVYTANQFSATLANLNNAMKSNSVPIDPMAVGATPQALPTLYGVTVTADSNANGATSVARTVVCSLNTPPLLSTRWNVTATAGTGAFSIYSSSPQDSGPIGGAPTGLQAITITFADAAFVTVTLNGRTPVAFNNAGHGIITSVTLTNVGSLGANAGTIYIIGPGVLGGSAGNVGIINPNTGLPYTPVVATIPQSFYSIYPDAGGAASQKQPFRGWILNGLTQQVGPIVFADTVLT